MGLNSTRQGRSTGELCAGADTITLFLFGVSASGPWLAFPSLVSRGTLLLAFTLIPRVALASNDAPINGG